MNSIVWFDRDLRLADHPALHRAARDGAVIPVYIWAPEERSPWQPGGAHRWWLHHSLYALATDLESRGSGLVLRSATSSLAALEELIEESGADRVLWNDRLEPAIRRRDDRIEERLSEMGVEVIRFQSAILHDPDEIRTGKGTPYRVFTPFWKKFGEIVSVSRSLPTPDLDRSAIAQWPQSESIENLQLLPEVDWAEGLRETWRPGERAASAKLQRFVDESIVRYAQRRNFPDRDGTSMLSPHLCWGEISPRQVWNHVREHARAGDGEEAFLREIGWREFSYHLLYHFPHTTTEPLDGRYENFPWEDNVEHLRQWQKGMTGYPIVDAGMRQLWHTGWMHNRVRMIVASFLTKDLLLPWQEGARWFWDTLVDGDLANNTQGWQWAAGSGADAQPFFRIFNPISQGERYDPDGHYVRQWVPEIATLPDKYLHCPWDAPDQVLSDAGIELGTDYPSPIVDHGEARKRALAAFEHIS